MAWPTRSAKRLSARTASYTAITVTGLSRGREVTGQLRPRSDVAPRCETVDMKLSSWKVNAIFGSEVDIPPDRYLFHYTSVERCAAIGFTGCIALGPLTPMNDPRESQLRQVMTHDQRRERRRKTRDGGRT